MNLGSTAVSKVYLGSSEVSKIYLGSTEAWSSEFDPLSLSPALWLDASDAGTLYDATAGGSLVAADATVARWQDKSGNARHATQATSGARPTRKTAIQNGLDVLRFDGADWLASVAFSGTETSTTYLVVSSMASQYAVLAAWADANGSPDPGAGYMAVNSGRFESRQDGASDTSKTSINTSSSSTILATGSWAVIAEINAATHAGRSIRGNGSSLGSTSALANNPGTYTKTATAFGIGARNTGGAASQCDIGEVIHFNRHLNTDERASLESYLMQKWGIS